MPDKGDWYHLVDDGVILRRLEPKPKRRCQCCGEWYERGSFRCCAAPAGTPSQVWLARCCKACGCCPKHCACVDPVPYERPIRPLATLAESMWKELREGKTEPI